MPLPESCALPAIKPLLPSGAHEVLKKFSFPDVQKHGFGINYLHTTIPALKQSPAELHLYLVAQQLLRVDFYDVYAITFRCPHPVPVEAAVKAFLPSMPRSVRIMLGVREAVARRIGLKTAHGKEAVAHQVEAFSGNVGETIALFEVWQRSETEIVTGQRDKHLDFALSFYLHRNGDEHHLKLITAVQLHNMLGRIYFALVKPVHRQIMPLIVKRIGARLVQARY
jgi:hypothetical protein